MWLFRKLDFLFTFRQTDGCVCVCKRERERERVSKATHKTERGRVVSSARYCFFILKGVGATPLVSFCKNLHQLKNLFIIVIVAIIYHCTKSASAVLPGTLVYKRRTSQNKGLGGESASVTRWLEFKFYAWPFTTMKICQITKSCQRSF